MFEGTYVAMVTEFTGGRVDLDGVRSLAERASPKDNPAPRNAHD